MSNPLSSVVEKLGQDLALATKVDEDGSLDSLVLFSLVVPLVTSHVFSFAS